MENGIKILIYGLFILDVILVRFSFKSLLHPIRILVAAYGFVIFVPLIIWNSSTIWNGRGIIWLELAILAMALGASIVNAFFKSGKNKDCCKKLNSIKEVEWIWVYLVIGIAIYYLISYISINGYSVKSFNSFDSLLDVNAEMARRRYYTGTRTSYVVKYMLFSVYLCSLVGGYTYNYASDFRKRAISVLTLIPSLAISLISNGKQGIIAAGILFFAGWAVSKMELDGELPVVKIKYLIMMIVGCVLFVVFLIFLMFLRVGDFSQSMQIVIFNKFFIYAFGETINFDGWFSMDKGIDYLDWGRNTYMAILKPLGVVRVQGVYKESLFGYGNIYTVYRGVIQDFGVYGGLVYCFIRGIITQYSILSIQRAKTNTCIEKSLVVGQYLFGILGILISPWVYASYILCMFVFIIFINLFSKKRFKIILYERKF